MKKEFRAQPAEMRAAADEQGALRFEGYAALFNFWSDDRDGFREKITPDHASGCGWVSVMDSAARC